MKECSNFKLDNYSSFQPETRQESSIPFPKMITVTSLMRC